MSSRRSCRTEGKVQAEKSTGIEPKVAESCCDFQEIDPWKMNKKQLLPVLDKDFKGSKT